MSTQLVVPGSDQLESLSSFGHCALFTFRVLCNLLFYFFLVFVMHFNFVLTSCNSAKKKNKQNKTEI